MDGTTLMTDYIVTFPTTVSNILDISVVLSSY